MMEPTCIAVDREQRSGLFVYVYRHAAHGDLTSGGFSGQHDRLVVVGIVTLEYSTGHVHTLMPTHSRQFSPTKDWPAAWLYGRYILDDLVWCIVPALPVDATANEILDHLTRLSDGGNFAHSGDGRMREITGEYAALPIHDRRVNF
jgi:hypothetical protein